MTNRSSDDEPAESGMVMGRANRRVLSFLLVIIATVFTPKFTIISAWAQTPTASLAPVTIRGDTGTPVNFTSTALGSKAATQRGCALRQCHADHQHHYRVPITSRVCRNLPLIPSQAAR